MYSCRHTVREGSRQFVFINHLLLKAAHGPVQQKHLIDKGKKNKLARAMPTPCVHQRANCGPEVSCPVFGFSRNLFAEETNRILPVSTGGTQGGSLQAS